MGLLLEWADRDSRVRPKVTFVLPLGNAAEAPKDQVIVCVVPGVLYGHILEQTAVCTKNLVRLGPHLLATTKHTPRPAVPSLR